MKYVSLALISLTLISESALSMGTSDNINYVITISENSSWMKCSKLICSVSKKHGNGQCSKFPTIGIVSANLTTYGHDLLLSHSSCELTIEAEQVVDANPKLGTSN